MNVKIAKNDNSSNIFYTKENVQKLDKKNKKRYFAGQNNENNTKLLINEKKTRAREKARKLIDDAWKTENKVNDNIQSMRNNHANTLNEIKHSTEMLKDIENTKEQLRKEYDVELDSREQEDLELLQKKQDMDNKIQVEKFSEEELIRLKELEGSTLTEYQKSVLEINNTAKEYKEIISNSDENLQNITSSISQAKIEQSKLRAMEKANRVADKIIEASNEEIIGILRENTINNVDKQQKEELEKAEKKEEKEEAKEERLDEIKENNKENTKLIEEVQEEIRKIKNKNNLTDDDLKGIDIDYNL